jgi:hypothetical protein
MTFLYNTIKRILKVIFWLVFFLCVLYVCYSIVYRIALETMEVPPKLLAKRYTGPTIFDVIYGFGDAMATRDCSDVEYYVKFYRPIFEDFISHRGIFIYYKYDDFLVLDYHLGAGFQIFLQRNEPLPRMLREILPQGSTNYKVLIILILVKLKFKRQKKNLD